MSKNPRDMQMMSLWQVVCRG